MIALGISQFLIHSQQVNLETRSDQEQVKIVPAGLPLIGRSHAPHGRPECVREANYFIRNYDEFGREAKMAKQVNCDCGFMVRTQSEDEMVEHVQLHAREIHQMDVPRDKALEMAKNVEATVTV